MKDDGKTIAKFRVGSVNYVRYTKQGETFVSVEGHSHSDKDYVWKVKVDKSSRRRYYVNLGEHGRRWLLPDEYPPPPLPRSSGARGTTPTKNASPKRGSSPPKHQPDSVKGAAAASPTSERDGVSQEPHLPPELLMRSPPHPRGAPTSPGSEVRDTASPVELYFRRSHFNPLQPSSKEQVPTAEEIVRVVEVLSEEGITNSALPPDAILSIVMVALSHSGSSTERTVRDLCDAVRGEAGKEVLKSPFLECSMNVTYLQSVAEAVTNLVKEQSGDIAVIKDKITEREQERRKAVAKLNGWKYRCMEVDKEVEEACEEGFRIATGIGNYLARVDRIVSVLERAPIPRHLVDALRASLEKHRSQAQERCNDIRMLQESYARIMATRGDLESILSALSSRGGPEDSRLVETELDLVRQLDGLRKQLDEVGEERHHALAIARRMQEQLENLRRKETRDVGCLADMDDGKRSPRKELRCLDVVAIASKYVPASRMADFLHEVRESEGGDVRTPELGPAEPGHKSWRTSECFSVASDEDQAILLDGIGEKAMTCKGGPIYMSTAEKATLLNIINHQKTLLKTMTSRGRCSTEDEVLRMRLAASEDELRRQATQIDDLKSLILTCLQVDDPHVRAMLNPPLSLDLPALSSPETPVPPSCEVAGDVHS